MTEKINYFGELEKVAEKLLFPYEIQFLNGISISKRYVDNKGVDLRELKDWIEYFGVFFENQYKVEKLEVEKHYIKNEYFNYSSIIVDFWNFGNDFKIEKIKCYGFDNKSNNTDIEIVNKEQFYKIIPFFIDSDIFEIHINGNKLIYKTAYFTNPNLGKNNKLLNFIGNFNIQIQEKYILRTKIHPLKNNFQNEIFGFQNEIQEELFGSLECKSNQDHLGGMSDVIDVVYESRLTLIQAKIDKIIRYIFRISDNPQKERKKILLQDFSKQKLDRSFGRNIIKNQKFLEENDREYENGYFKTKDNELNIKNVKQYGYVDEYNTKLNKFIKSKLYEFILKTKNLGLDIGNKINPYLNYKHFKDVNLNLYEQIPDSLQQYQDYYSLYKELNNTYDIDIYGLENKLKIKSLDDWFELFCMIRLKWIFSSYKAKELGFEIIDNNLYKNLFDGDKIKKEDDGNTSRIKFKKGEYELHLTFGANLVDINGKKGKTPDYTIEFYKNGSYGGMLILDAKYSIQFNKEYNIFIPVTRHIDECREKYVKNKTFINNKSEVKNKDSGVQKLILLYPGRIEGNFKTNFESYIDFNKQLLKTGVGIFPVNIGESNDFDGFFLSFIDETLNNLK